MFHQNWFIQDGYFGDHHYDNFRVISNYNLSQIKFYSRMFFFFLLFVCILLFILHPFNVFVCFTHFQCFCLFVFCYLFYTFSMFLFVYILLFVLHLFNVFFLGGLFVFYCEFFFNESDFSSPFAQQIRNVKNNQWNKMTCSEIYKIYLEK